MTRSKVKQRRGNAADETSGAYQVGYRKPPTAHQFQKGRSGNPKGRPRGRKNFAQMLTSILHGKVRGQLPYGLKAHETPSIKEPNWLGAE
jgi:Family of unknown function (DUF5681)